MKTFKNLFFIVFMFWTSRSKMMSFKIERNVPLVVVDSFNAVFCQRSSLFSRYQGENNQELVYEAKFIFDDRYCKSVYDFNGNQIAFATVDYLELPEGKYMEEKYPLFQLLKH
jgi:hypothetical protein